MNTTTTAASQTNNLRLAWCFTNPLQKVAVSTPQQPTVGHGGSPNSNAPQSTSACAATAAESYRTSSTQCCAASIPSPVISCSQPPSLDRYDSLEGLDLHFLLNGGGVGDNTYDIGGGNNGSYSEIQDCGPSFDIDEEISALFLLDDIKNTEEKASLPMNSIPPISVLDDDSASFYDHLLMSTTAPPISTGMDPSTMTTSTTSTKKRKREVIKQVTVVPKLVDSAGYMQSYTPKVILAGFHAFCRSKSATVEDNTFNNKMQSFYERNIYVTKSNESGFLYFILDNAVDLSCSNFEAKLELLSHDYNLNNSFEVVVDDEIPTDAALKYGIVRLPNYTTNLMGSNNLLLGYKDWKYINIVRHSRDLYSGGGGGDTPMTIASSSISLPMMKGRFLLVVKPLRGLKSLSDATRAFQSIALTYSDGTVYHGLPYKTFSKDLHNDRTRKRMKKEAKQDEENLMYGRGFEYV